MTIAATNANLDHLVHEGRFRADLYYRLNVIPLELPPLRDRRDEIPHFVRQFVARAAAEFGKGQLRIDNEMMELLSLYAWPGNIRQLNNFEGSLPSTLARIERQLVNAALKQHHGRVDATAKALGISRKGLYLKRQRFGL